MFRTPESGLSPLSHSKGCDPLLSNSAEWTLRNSSKQLNFPSNEKFRKLFKFPSTTGRSEENHRQAPAFRVASVTLRVLKFDNIERYFRKYSNFGAKTFCEFNKFRLSNDTSQEIHPAAKPFIIKLHDSSAQESTEMWQF